MLTGNHSTIREIMTLIEKIADTDSSILIQGESGTGKELVALSAEWKREEKQWTI